MTKRMALIAGVVAGVACNQAAEPVTPEPDAASSSAPEVASSSAPDVASPTPASLCDELAAVLEASRSSYAGLALEDKPVKGEKGTSGFQARQPLTGALSCAVFAAPDRSYRCELGPAAWPAESGAVLKGWEAKLEACPALATPFKKRPLGDHGSAWSDDKSKGERNVSLAFSGDDMKPRPVLVVRLYE